jgi:hypothetical protein
MAKLSVTLRKCVAQLIGRNFHRFWSFTEYENTLERESGIVTVLFNFTDRRVVKEAHEVIEIFANTVMRCGKKWHPKELLYFKLMKKEATWIYHIIDVEGT